MAQAHHLDPRAVVEAVTDGVRAAERALDIKVNQIGILSRHFGPEIAWQELECLLASKYEFVGLDLAGDEAHFPGSLFVDHFKKARDAGWHITAHSGESAGAQSIWQAIDELGAERIGHAVHAVDDPALLDALHERQIGIECNLTSNVQTSTVSDYGSHPLKLFLAKGLLATLNTDDPGISAIDLHHEYETAAVSAGLDEHMIRQAQHNALEIAFLSPSDKKELLGKKAHQGGTTLSKNQ
jgi:adenosine deaminase